MILQSGSDGIFGCTDNNVNNCTLDGGALPVDLVRFVVSADEDFVALEWTTATEENFDFFSIERSEDGKGFYEIGTVDGHGESQTPINYNFDDLDPIFGRSYYRLNAIDYDGSYEKFQTISVEFVPKELKVSIYPNPSQGGDFRIRLGAPKQLDVQHFILLNIDGSQIVQRNLVVGNNEISLPHALNQGIYIAKIQIDNYITTHRLVVN